MSATQSDLVCGLAEGSRIKVVGLGGIGCAVLQYLAVFLKSLDRPLRLVLIDGDQFEMANGRRMVFQSVGNKAEVKAAETVRRDDFRGLRHLADRLGGRFRAGIVLYAGEQQLSFGDRLTALPLAALWALEPAE